MDYKKILIAVDNSPYSKNAIQKGIALARQLNAKVAVVTVVDPTLAVGTVDSGIFAEETWNNFMAEANDYLHGLKSQYADVVTDTFVEGGNPIHEVIAVCHRWNADLIITGTHGRSGLSHLLMGSVAESILKQANVPVMIVGLR